MRPFETRCSGSLTLLAGFAKGWIILSEEEMAGWSKNKLPLKCQHRQCFCIRLLAVLSSTSQASEGFPILPPVSSNWSFSSCNIELDSTWHEARHEGSIEASS